MKILTRCDADEDGNVDEGEFLAYYERTAAAMSKFHRAQAAQKGKVGVGKSPLVESSSMISVLSMEDGRGDDDTTPLGMGYFAALGKDIIDSP